MPIFEYKAIDAKGNPAKGNVFSQSLAAAAEDLTKRGFQVQELALAHSAQDPIPQSFARQEAPTPWMNDAPPTEQRSALVTDVLAPLVYKVPLSQLLFFFRQLGTMLDAGVPMISSLETLARQARDPKLRPIVQELYGHAKAGRELSVGMSRYPEVFTPLMLSMVRAGEQGGMLDDTLMQMADYVEQEIQLRNLLRKATLYPKIVIATSVVVILFANYIIRDVFGRPGGIASPLTEPATWVVLGPLLVFLFLFFRVGASNPRFKPAYDQLLFMIPIIGPTVHQMAMAKFARSFAALYRAGVPMPRALELAADACGSDYLRWRMYPAARALESGMGITDSLRQTGAFIPTVLEMTQTGETTGRIDEMLSKVADYYGDDSQVRANQLAMIFGVICFLAVAAYVGYVVISFYQGHATSLSSVGQ